MNGKKAVSLWIVTVGCVSCFAQGAPSADLQSELNEFGKEQIGLIEQNAPDQQKQLFRQKWQTRFAQDIATTSGNGSDIDRVLENLVRLYSSSHDFKSALQYNEKAVTGTTSPATKVYWAINCAELAKLCKKQGQCAQMTVDDILGEFQTAHDLLKQAADVRPLRSRIPSFLFEYATLLQANAQSEAALPLFLEGLNFYSDAKSKLIATAFTSELFLREAIVSATQLGKTDVSEKLLSQYISSSGKKLSVEDLAKRYADAKDPKRGAVYRTSLEKFLPLSSATEQANLKYAIAVSDYKSEEFVAAASLIQEILPSFVQRAARDHAQQPLLSQLLGSLEDSLRKLNRVDEANKIKSFATSISQNN